MGLAKLRPSPPGPSRHPIHARATAPFHSVTLSPLAALHVRRCISPLSHSLPTCSTPCAWPPPFHVSPPLYLSTALTPSSRDLVTRHAIVPSSPWPSVLPHRRVPQSVPLPSTSWTHLPASCAATLEPLPIHRRLHLYVYVVSASLNIVSPAVVATSYRRCCERASKLERPAGLMVEQRGAVLHCSKKTVASEDAARPLYTFQPMKLLYSFRPNSS
jgi:hypothetical protein